MKRSRFIALSVLLDALFVNIGIVASFYLRFGGDIPSFNFDPYLGLAPIITVIYLLSGYVYGLYEPERTEHPWAVARAVIASVSLGTALTTALLFLAGPDFFSFSRLVLVISWFVLMIALSSWRMVFLRITSITWPEQRLVVVGIDAIAHEVAEEFSRRSKWGYRVEGLVAPDGPTLEAGTAIASAFPILGTLEDLTSIVAERDVDRVVVVSPIAVRELIERLALADESRVRVDVVPELYEIFIGTVDSMVADIPLMEITRSTVPPWFVAAKRGFDIVGSLVLLVILSPVLLVAALAVLSSAGAPALFVQERVGQDRHPFNLYKFRTMVVDAEKETGPVLASEGDSRITAVGRVLRTYRIDELPQLVNILKGEMSFVGPRPEREFFVEQFVRDIPGYRERFRIKPGVTGLAQVSGSYATTPERKLKYDLIYMYHQNLPMDAQIMVETVRVVLTGRGAR